MTSFAIIMDTTERAFSTYVAGKKKKEARSAV